MTLIKNMHDSYDVKELVRWYLHSSAVHGVLIRRHTDSSEESIVAVRGYQRNGAAFTETGGLVMPVEISMTYLRFRLLVSKKTPSAMPAISPTPPTVTPMISAMSTSSVEGDGVSGSALLVVALYQLESTEISLKTPYLDRE
jgi:hypothetical protein